MKFLYTLAALSMALISVSADGPEVAWTIKAYDDMQVTDGCKVTFTYTSAHNLYEFASAAAYDACDFTGATELGASGPTTVTFSDTGTV